MILLLMGWYKQICDTLMSWTIECEQSNVFGCVFFKNKKEKKIVFFVCAPFLRDCTVFYRRVLGRFGAGEAADDIKIADAVEF